MARNGIPADVLTEDRYEEAQRLCLKASDPQGKTLRLIESLRLGEYAERLRQVIADMTKVETLLVTKKPKQIHLLLDVQREVSDVESVAGDGESSDDEAPQTKTTKQAKTQTETNTKTDEMDEYDRDIGGSPIPESLEDEEEKSVQSKKRGRGRSPKRTPSRGRGRPPKSDKRG